LSKILGIGETKVDSSGNLYSDVTIKLGRDWIEKERAYNTVNQKVR
ncbi:MAG: hypothetical protein HC778_00695, partial [Chamaesiphon sp. CSU_1_12]|nr:hypothetical protein [Chamaesiphon sp. CSU_1_12]